MSYVYELQDRLKKKYSISENDWKELWELFMEYGMTRGEAQHRSKGNHYFLQGVCEHLEIEYRCWKGKMTKELKDIILKKYPQLMVTDKSFSKNSIQNKR